MHRRTSLAAMNANKVPNRFLLAAIVATFAPPLWASTVLTFEVARHTTAAKGAEQVKGATLPVNAN
jgi:hypothetical protein